MIQYQKSITNPIVFLFRLLNTISSCSLQILRPFNWWSYSAFCSTSGSIFLNFFRPVSILNLLPSLLYFWDLLYDILYSWPVLFTRLVHQPWSSRPMTRYVFRNLCADICTSVTFLALVRYNDCRLFVCDTRECYHFFLKSRVINFWFIDVDN